MHAEESPSSNMENEYSSDEIDKSKERDRHLRSDRPNSMNTNGRDRSRERNDGRKVSDRRVYVSNIPYEYKWQNLKDLFREEVGKVSHVKYFKDDNDKPRGCGIVEFEDSDSVQLAIEKMHQYDINGRKLVVKEDYEVERDKYGRMITGRNNDRNRDDWFRDQPRSNSSKQTFSNSVGGSNSGITYGLNPNFLESLGITGSLTTRVFVANLDFKVDDKKLTEVFKLAGKVLQVEIAKDKEGKSRGFGVVEYDHPVESVQAISMLHNQPLYERRMIVRLDRINESDGPPKLPEGLKSVGMGLGAGGNRLTDVARNIPYLQPNNTPVVSPISTPVFGTGAFGLSNAQLATALANNNVAALQASLASGLGSNLTTNSLLSSSLSNDLASKLNSLNQGAANLANLQATLANAQSNNAFAATGLSKLDTELAFGNSKAFVNSPFINNRDFDGSFNRGDADRISGGGGGGVNRQSSNGTRQVSDTVLIKNLPQKTTWQMLRDKCKDIGDVKFAEMRGSDVGLVRFSSEKEAERAVIRIHQSHIDGRTIEARLY